ncbi:exopolysaccharide biosynthesis protein [Actinophytocola sediminis]
MEQGTTETVGLSLVGRVVRRRWRLLVGFALAGAVLGAAVSPLLSPGYQTSVSVLLQGPRETDELRTEAQVAASSVVLDRAAATLGWGVPGSELAKAVEAAVADGNIIEVTVVADSPERAQALADRVAQEYVAFSTQLLGDTEDAAARVSQEQQQALREQVNLTMQRISELHDSTGQGGTIDSVGVRTGLESLRTSLAQAVTKLDELDAVTGQAKMVVMGSAQRPTGPAAPTMLHLACGGALLFLVLGLFGHLLSTRVDKRLRAESQIAAALGTTVLGSVDVPVEPDDQPAAGRLRRLLGLVARGAPEWHAPEPLPAGDDHSLEVRYRRVLARLAERTPDGLLTVVADDDPPAARAAARLADTSGGGRVRVAEVSAAHPVVPDRTGAEAGVLMVLTAGTRTAWELVGIAQACADAGQAVLGAVVANRAGPSRAGPPAAVPADSVPADAVTAGTP